MHTHTTCPIIVSNWVITFSYYIMLSSLYQYITIPPKTAYQFVNKICTDYYPMTVLMITVAMFSNYYAHAVLQSSAM